MAARDNSQRLAAQIAKDAEGVAGPMVRWLRDFLTHPDDLQAPVTMEDYEGFVATLEGTLGTTTASDSDTFDVPSTHNFVVKEIRGHLSWSAALTGESVIAFGGNALTTATNPGSVLASIIQKAMNTQIALKLAAGNRKIFDGNGLLSLADILTLVGGKPIEFPAMAPLIIPASSQIQMTTTAIVATDAQQGKAFNCGIVMVGNLIRC